MARRAARSSKRAARSFTCRLPPWFGCAAEKINRRPQVSASSSLALCQAGRCSATSRHKDEIEPAVGVGEGCGPASRRADDIERCDRQPSRAARRARAADESSNPLRASVGSALAEALELEALSAADVHDGSRRKQSKDHPREADPVAGLVPVPEAVVVRRRTSAARVDAGDRCTTRRGRWCSAARHHPSSSAAPQERSIRRSRPRAARRWWLVRPGSRARL